MKWVRFLFITPIMMATFADAFTMPSAPSQVNSTFDEIRTTDGATCRSANGGNIILHGGVSRARVTDELIFDNGMNYDDSSETGIYMGFAMSYGGGKKIDCSRLANIEFEKAQLELENLRAQVAALQQLKNIQLLEESGSLPPLD